MKINLILHGFDKLSNFEEAEENIRYGTRKLAELSLDEIGKYDPMLEKKLRDGAFEKAKNERGEYVCACCGRAYPNRVCLQADHILPMNRGEKSVPENLQILCRYCNGKKGDS